jgi:NAD(P)-dependent dehydrogenase (short-subunit alcohol dehydrogenase family)
MAIIVITGGNQGLGFETARRLKELCHSVYIGSRNEERGQASAMELGVECVVVDVTSEESVILAATYMEEKEGKLDVLINNAGIAGSFNIPRDLTADKVYEVYNTNVFGIVRMTHHFLPLLEKSDNPVIVNVGSGLGSFGQVLNPDKIESKVNSLAYCSSKSAVSMLTVQYAKSLPNIRINAVDPGPTKTNLTGQGFQSITEGTDAIVKMATIDKNGPTCTFTDRKGTIPW